MLVGRRDGLSKFAQVPGNTCCVNPALGKRAGVISHPVETTRYIRKVHAPQKPGGADVLPGILWGQ